MVIFGLALAAVARARSSSVKVLAAINGEPPDGIKRLLTAWMSSVSTNASKCSGAVR